VIGAGETAPAVLGLFPCQAMFGTITAAATTATSAAERAIRVDRIRAMALGTIGTNSAGDQKDRWFKFSGRLAAALTA
jgi:hypothetical protein